jgi:RNase P subunit RPR2
MKNLLCGSCALKASLDLSERLEIANSRKLGVEYHCLGCGKVHSWTFKRNGEETDEMVERVETVETSEIEEESEIFIQTRLF